MVPVRHIKSKMALLDYGPMCVCCDRRVGEADPLSQNAAATAAANQFVKKKIAGGPTHSSSRIRRPARLRLARA